jgi:hypothetical protein
LIIREEQFDAFLPKTDSEMIEFIIEHLQEETPELIDRIPLDGLQEMVGNGINRARSHKLSSLGNITAFVSIMFEIAPNFDEQPEIKQVLDDTNEPIDKNFDLLFEPRLDEAWEKATNGSPDNWAEAWFPELKESEEN